MAWRYVSLGTPITALMIGGAANPSIPPEVYNRALDGDEISPARHWVARITVGSASDIHSGNVERAPSSVSFQAAMSASSCDDSAGSISPRSSSHETVRRNPSSHEISGSKPSASRALLESYVRLYFRSRVRSSDWSGRAAAMNSVGTWTMSGSGASIARAAA